MADETKDQEKQPKKKGKLMFIVIMGAVIVVALGAGIGAGMMLGGGGSVEAAQAAQGGAASEKPEAEYVLSFDTFIVNLADQDKDRFVKATLRAVVTDSETQGMLSGDPLLKARVRDRILSILSSRSFSEISSPLGKESLRREIVVELNHVLPQECVKEVLFAEFIVQ
jgi:flagellar FliL protein